MRARREYGVRYARGCKTEVRPERLMCLRHWRQVPPELQAVILNEWAKSNTLGELTPEYLAAIDAARDSIRN